MSAIDMITKTLNQLPRSDDNSLTLQAADFNSAQVTLFFQRALSGQPITVSQAAIASPSDQMVSVSGRAALLGYEDVATTLTFRALDDDADLEVSVTGAFDERKTISLPAVTWISLHTLRIEMTVKSEFGILTFKLYGTLNVGDVAIPIAIAKIGASEWRIGIAEGGRGIALPDLNHLAALIGGEAAASFFPQPLVDAISGIELGGIACQFNPTDATVSYFTVAITVANSWQLAPKIELKSGMSLSLVLVNPVGPLQKSVVGTVRGTAVISGQEIPIFVQGSGGSSTRWSVGVFPDDGIVLPSLASLLELAGGDDFINSLPSGFSKIPSIMINRLQIDFDPVQKTLNLISFAVSTAGVWEIIGGYLTVQYVSVEMDINNLTVPAQRSILGTVRSAFQLGDASIQFSLRRTSPSDEWTLTGELPPGQTFNLTDVAARLFDSSITIPADAPPIVFTQLSASVTPKTGKLVFSAQSTSAWEIVAKTLSVKTFRLEFSRDPIQANPIAGTIATTLTIAGVDLSLSAALNTGGAGGWQFQGSTGPGQAIPIGTLIDDLTTQFNAQGELPTSIADLVIQNLHVSFNTRTKDFTFGCEAKFPLDGRTVDILIAIDLKQTKAGYRKLFSGVITVGELRFTLKFAQDAAVTAFVATYSHTGAQRLKVGELVGAALTLDGQLRTLLESLEIDLKDLLFVYHKQPPALAGTSPQASFLFGLDIGAQIGLSSLPLVGKQFPPDQSAGVDNLRLLVASADLTQAEVAAINAMLPAGITPIAVAPPPAQAGQAAGEVVVLTKGATISAQLSFGGTSQTLALPVAPSGSASGAGTNIAASSQQPVGVTSSDSAKWFTLQKTFGPLELQRVGVQYKDAVLWFLLDAALSAAGLSLTLDGLALGSPITKFAPRFDLRGLGIDYRNEAIEIGGAFLRTRVVPTVGEPYDEFAGAAVVKAKTLTLSAIGAYAYLDGHPSLFVYAVLDYPIGGPSFFFVTGLAGGFGYNRALIVPPIEGVAQFPLVQLAMGTAPASASATNQAPPDMQPAPQNPALQVSKILSTLRAAVPPSPGRSFLAVGIRFTSFKIIDSFVLLTVAFGHRFELNVLGFSTLVVPPTLPGAEQAVEPLAQIQMALKASFIPAEGFLGVSAQLTTASYILSRACHLTGGFAFYSWFDGAHTGDFALTLGGYHPSYRVPAHYPRVPRLGINWQVDSRLAIKGEAYFALTASALMAGGQLQATWDSGDLKAWFQIGADFIISWKPYFYDARAYASLRVSYTFQFFGTQRGSFDASAQLHLWGPEFSGTGHIKVSIIEFDVEFGAGTRSGLQPIDWNSFQQSFLPQPASTTSGTPASPQSPCCGITVQSGLLRKIGDDPADLGIMNAKELVFVTNSLIPASAATIGNALAVSTLFYADRQPVPFKNDGTQGIVQTHTADGRKIATVGIAPMALREISSTHIIRILFTPAAGGAAQPVELAFTYTPVTKSVPAALWGGSLSPNLNSKDLVEHALAGFEIRPLEAVRPGHVVSARGWGYDEESVADAFRWEPAPEPIALDAQDRQPIADAIAALIGGES